MTCCPIHLRWRDPLLAGGVDTAHFVATSPERLPCQAVRALSAWLARLGPGRRLRKLVLQGQRVRAWRGDGPEPVWAWLRDEPWPCDPLLVRLQLEAEAGQLWKTALGYLLPEDHKECA